MNWLWTKFRLCKKQKSNAIFALIIFVKINIFFRVEFFVIIRIIFVNFVFVFFIALDEIIINFVVFLKIRKLRAFFRSKMIDL